MMQVWVIDENGFFIKSILTNKKEDNMTDIPLIESFYKAKLVNNQWIEGATEEEVKEWEEKNKPVKKEPTETEILQKQLLETQNLVLELQYKLTNKDLEIK